MPQLDNAGGNIWVTRHCQARESYNLPQVIDQVRKGPSGEPTGE